MQVTDGNIIQIAQKSKIIFTIYIILSILVEKCYARESPFLSSHERSQCGSCGGKLNTRPGWRGRKRRAFPGQTRPPYFVPAILALYSTFRRSYHIDSSHATTKTGFPLRSIFQLVFCFLSSFSCLTAGKCI